SGECQLCEWRDGFDNECGRLDVAVALCVAALQQHGNVSANPVRDRGPFFGKDQHLARSRKILDGETRKLRARSLADLFLDCRDDDTQRNRITRPGAELRDRMRRKQLALEL